MTKPMATKPSIKAGSWVRIVNSGLPAIVEHREGDILVVSVPDTDKLKTVHAGCVNEIFKA